MQSEAESVDAYLAELPEPRRGEVAKVLEFVRAHMPDGLSEEMGFGMINWVVPLEVVPDTYNGKPLVYAGLASQKRHISLYLMTLYAGAVLTEDEFRARWSGPKKLNMGKSCVRFTKFDDLDTELIAEVLDGVSMADYIGAYEASKSMRSQRRT